MVLCRFAEIVSRKGIVERSRHRWRRLQRQATTADRDVRHETSARAHGKSADRQAVTRVLGGELLDADRWVEGDKLSREYRRGLLFEPPSRR